MARLAEDFHRFRKLDVLVMPLQAPCASAPLAGGHRRMRPLRPLPGGSGRELLHLAPTRRESHEPLDPRRVQTPTNLIVKAHRVALLHPLLRIRWPALIPVPGLRRPPVRDRPEVRRLPVALGRPRVLPIAAVGGRPQILRGHRLQARAHRPHPARRAAPVAAVARRAGGRQRARPGRGGEGRQRPKPGCSPTPRHTRTRPGPRELFRTIGRGRQQGGCERSPR
jgi:hypothetical protein